MLSDQSGKRSQVIISNLIFNELIEAQGHNKGHKNKTKNKNNNESSSAEH